MPRRGVLARYRPPGDLTLDVGVDWRVLGFALAAAVAAAAIFGLAPALNLTRLGASAALKDGALAAVGKRRVGLRGALIAAQVSVSLVLLVCAGLFLRSLQQAATVDPGFDADNVVVASFDLRTQGYAEPRAVRSMRSSRSASRACPTFAPSRSRRGCRCRATAAAAAPASRATSRSPARTWSSTSTSSDPSTSRSCACRSSRGRGFTAADREGAPQVAVVNETFAARYWPGEDPIGKRLTSFSGATSIEIVGVARDGKYQMLTEAPLPYLYRPFLQDYEEMTLHVRVARDADSFLPLLRSEIRAVDERAADREAREHAQRDGVRDVPAARRRDVARRLRRARAVARGRGSLRRRGLCREPAHARDRHSHGARGRPSCRRSHGARGQHEGRRGRARDRLCCSRSLRGGPSSRFSAT